MTFSFLRTLISSTIWPPLSLTSMTRVTLQSSARKPFLSMTRESVVAEEVGKGSEATSQAGKSKCTSECKRPRSGRELLLLSCSFTRAAFQL